MVEVRIRGIWVMRGFGLMGVCVAESWAVRHEVRVDRLGNEVVRELENWGL